MIKIQDNLKKIISTLKNDLYIKEKYELFDLVNNSFISVEYVFSNGFYDSSIDFYKMIVELDVQVFSKVSKKFEIQNLEEELIKELNLILKDENEQVSVVVIKPLIDYYINWSFISNIYSRDEFINDVLKLKEMLIDTSIGKLRIENVNDEYMELYEKIDVALSKLELENPNTFKSMWEVYNYWKLNLDSYAERRIYFSNMYADLMKIILKDTSNKVSQQLQYTGWDEINKIIAKIKQAYIEANTVAQYNGIGAMCRNLYNNLADYVYKNEYHMDTSIPIPTGDKYKNKITEYIVYKLKNQSNEDFRNYCKKTIDLADTLTHKTTANKQQAALTITSMISVINIIEILENNNIEL